MSPERTRFLSVVAIREAEKESSGGVLQLTRWRAANKIEELQLKCEFWGSATKPREFRPTPPQIEAERRSDRHRHWRPSHAIRKNRCLCSAR
jgi:hypothetical protein